jgi:carbohydrate diacid regulator
MTGRGLLELCDLKSAHSLKEKEEELHPLNKADLKSSKDGTPNRITLNLGENTAEDEVPLEYAGHVIGSLKINRNKGQGTLDISNSVMEMFLRKAFLVEERQREKHAKELLVSLLLNQVHSNCDLALETMGRILGYGIEDPQVVFIVEFEKKECFDEQSPEWKRLQSVAIKIVEDYFKYSGGYIVVSFYNGRLLVLKNIVLEEILREHFSFEGSEKEKGKYLSKLRKQLTSMAESLRQAIMLGTKQDVSIGIGECRKGVFAARNSYQDACLALKMGKYFKEIKRAHVFHVFDFALESLLAQVKEEEKNSFIEHYLGSIRGEKELLETLEAFFQCNLNIAQASEKSFLHRNTFTYRLDKIQCLTGLNPRSFYDALVLAVALIMKQIDAHRTV